MASALCLIPSLTSHRRSLDCETVLRCTVHFVRMRSFIYGAFENRLR